MMISGGGFLLMLVGIGIVLWSLHLRGCLFWSAWIIIGALLAYALLTYGPLLITH